MEYTIYFIENEVNHKGYVGMTSNSVEERFQHHLADAKSGLGYYLQNAIRKHGEDNFRAFSIEQAETEEEAFELEREWISRLDTYEGPGYNMTAGGERGPIKAGEDNYHSTVSDDRAYEVVERYLMEPSFSTNDAAEEVGTSKQSVVSWINGRWRPYLLERFHEEHPDYDGWTELHQRLYDAVVEYMTTRATPEEAASNHGLTESQVRAARDGCRPKVLERFHEEHPTWDGVVKDRKTRALLTKEDVIEIRKRYVREDTTCPALSEEYGVTESTINSIINFQSWDDVQSEVDDVLRNGGGSSRRTPERLTKDDAEEIRRRYEEEDITQTALGDEYGFDQTYISDIVNHRASK